VSFSACCAVFPFSFFLPRIMLAFAMPDGASTRGTENGEHESGETSPTSRVSPSPERRKRSRSKTGDAGLARKRAAERGAQELVDAAAAQAESARLTQQFLQQQQQQQQPQPEPKLADLRRMVSPAMMEELRKANPKASSDDWFLPILETLVRSGNIVVFHFFLLYMSCSYV
jgi:hypothetical protein